MQQIFTYAGTSIDRIRDSTRHSRYGLSSDLTEVLTDIYRDDVMQPKPSALLRLQDFTIKTWLSSSKLNIAKDTAIHLSLLDFMLQTNEKMITDWVKQTENLQTKKDVIKRDLLRFEIQCDFYNN
jgi:hypothetical protein